MRSEHRNTWMWIWHCIATAYKKTCVKRWPAELKPIQLKLVMGTAHWLHILCNRSKCVTLQSKDNCSVHEHFAILLIPSKFKCTFFAVSVCYFFLGRISTKIFPMTANFQQTHKIYYDFSGFLSLTHSLTHSINFLVLGSVRFGRCCSWHSIYSFGSVFLCSVASPYRNVCCSVEWNLLFHKWRAECLFVRRKSILDGSKSRWCWKIVKVAKTRQRARHSHSRQ